MLPEHRDLTVFLTRNMRIIAELTQGSDQCRLAGGARSDHHDLPRFCGGGASATRKVCFSHSGRFVSVTTGSWKWHLDAHTAYQRPLMMLRQCQHNDAHVVY